METKEFDLTGYVCPLSRIKATQVLNSLRSSETGKIIVGDAESLKSVAQELRARGIAPSFERQSESRFVLTITKT